MMIYQVSCGECGKPLARIAVVRKANDCYADFTCIECAEMETDEILDEINLNKKFNETTRWL